MKAYKVYFRYYINFCSFIYIKFSSFLHLVFHSKLQLFFVHRDIVRNRTSLVGKVHDSKSGLHQLESRNKLSENDLLVLYLSIVLDNDHPLKLCNLHVTYIVPLLPE